MIVSAAPAWLAALVGLVAITAVPFAIVVYLLR
jgi:hypothetical protein